MKNLHARTVKKYQPLADARQRWPGWLFVATALNGLRELICADGQLVFLDPAMWPDIDLAWAHVIGHLDLGHHLAIGDSLESGEEELADMLAAVRLDREEFRATLSG